jgi:hypothetical protein
MVSVRFHPLPHEGGHGVGSTPPIAPLQGSWCRLDPTQRPTSGVMVSAAAPCCPTKGVMVSAHPSHCPTKGVMVSAAAPCCPTKGVMVSAAAACCPTSGSWRRLTPPNAPQRGSWCRFAGLAASTKPWHGRLGGLTVPMGPSWDRFDPVGLGGNTDGASTQGGTTDSLFGRCRASSRHCRAAAVWWVQAGCVLRRIVGSFRPRKEN